MKTSFIFFLLIIFPLCFSFSPASGENPADSLLRVLDDYPDDTAKVNALMQTGYKLLVKIQYGQMIGLARKGLEIAKKINYEKGIADSYFLIGYYCMNFENYAEAIDTFCKSMKLYEKLHSAKGVASCCNVIGHSYWYRGDFANASKFYLDALRNFELASDTEKIANCLRNIGWIAFVLKNYSEALKYYELALTTYTKLGLSDEMATIFSDIGIVYQEQHKYQQAIDYHNKAFHIIEQLNDTESMAVTYGNLAISYQGLEQYSLSEKYLHLAIAMTDSMSDRVQLASYYNNLGDIKRIQKNYNAAIQFEQKALAESRKAEFKDGVKSALEMLSQIYADMKDFERAYKFYLMYASVKDSLFNEETSGQITEMQTKYETEKKEKEIALQKADIVKKEAVIKQQNIQRLAFAAGFALMLVLAFVILRAYRNKQKAHKIITAQKAEVELQKSIIEEKNKNITDSIEYASYIQKAVLPTDDEFYGLFPEAFILYKPRDIVSGDFYWVAPLQPKDDPPQAENPPQRGILETAIKPPLWGGSGGLLLCTADCTGHGVPGAFMSMLCTALLNEAVNDKGIMSPELIFEEIRRGIISALKQRGKTGEAKDGMDAAIISLVNWHMETSNSGISTFRLHAACANNPVYIVNNGVLKEIVPDRFPVGVYEGEKKPFTLREVKVKKGDMIYAMTDGFEDQLGGEKGKKLKSKRLRELLASIAVKQVKEQKEILEQTFMEWKGEGEQTDDLTIIGIRL